MKLGTYYAFTQKEDIQIQTSVAHLLVHITVPSSVSIEAVNIRIRAFGSKGAQTVIDRSKLHDHFQIAASKEGFFTKETFNGGNSCLYKGLVEIGVGGALALSNDSYLSLDMSCGTGEIAEVKLWAISAPTLVHEFQRVSPITVQDTIKDVPLAGVNSIVFNPANLSSLKFQYPDNSSDYDREELEAIGRQINDLVFVDNTNAGASVICAGFYNLIELDTYHASRVIIEPAGNTQFNMFLITSEVLN